MKKLAPLLLLLAAFGCPVLAHAEEPVVGPEEMDYEEGRPVPHGYTVTHQKRKGLIISGSIVLGVPYLFSAAAALAPDTKGFGDNRGMLLVPVVGPFVQAGAHRVDDGIRLLLVVDGLTQSAGALLLALGLTLDKTVLVRNDQLGLRVHPAPILTPQTQGLGVVGTF